MQNKHLYILRVILVGGIAIGTQSLNFNNKHIWMYSITRYVLYILTARAMYGACGVAYDVVQNKPAFFSGLSPGNRLWDQLLKKVNRHHARMFVAAIAFLLYNDQTLIDKSFFMILVATAIPKYPEIMKKKKLPVNYAVGMACSYFEGYLVHILPSDGVKFFGLHSDIREYEATQGVVFPVKKMFSVVTKSLYRPPDLKDMNKADRHDVAKIEACTILSEVVKDVAGVKNRVYRNFAYKIYRPNSRPVSLSVGGTPMHTFYKVLKNKDLSEVLSGINREETVTDFLNALHKIIAKSPQCRDKCELIYFDDTDREQNLADVLLDRIRELQPDFEDIIAQRM